jgi:integrase
MLRPPKAHSQRRVAIPATVMPVLEEHRTAQRDLQTRAPAWQSDQDYVFTTRTGRPLSAGNVHRSLRRLGKAAHIPEPFTPHDLRHTYATMMLEMDVHLTIVQKQLGHSSIRVTSDIYSHLSNRVQDTAGAAMDAVLAPRLAPHAKPDPDGPTARKLPAVDTQRDPK